jgi:hypothetical protein
MFVQIKAAGLKFAYALGGYKQVSDFRVMMALLCRIYF